MQFLFGSFAWHLFLIFIFSNCHAGQKSPRYGFLFRRFPDPPSRKTRPSAKNGVDGLKIEAKRIEAAYVALSTCFHQNPHLSCAKHIKTNCPTWDLLALFAANTAQKVRISPDYSSPPLSFMMASAMSPFVSRSAFCASSREQPAASITILMSSSPASCSS